MAAPSEIRQRLPFNLNLSLARRPIHRKVQSDGSDEATDAPTGLYESCDPRWWQLTKTPTPQRSHPSPRHIKGFGGVQRWISNVKRFISVAYTYREHDPRGFLHPLPPEIILDILDCLPKPDRWSFAITNRYYYVLASPAIGTLETNFEREVFLRTLVKEIPNLYFCWGCISVHRWNHRRRVYCKRWPYVCCEFVCSCPLSPRFKYHELGFTDAHLVMNRHRLGKDYGLPLKILEFSALKTDRHPPGRAVTNMKRKAVILDDKLYVHSKVQFFHPHGNQHVLLSFLRDKTICNHVSLRSRIPGLDHGNTVLFTLHEIPQLQLSDENGRLRACHQVLGSCPDCLTDYVLNILWGEKGVNKGWNIIVDVYQMFGSCRSPFEWEWRSMAELSELNEPRHLRVEAGVVRKRCILWKENQLVEGFVPEEGHYDQRIPDHHLDCNSGEFVGLPALAPYQFIRGERRCSWWDDDHSTHDCLEYGKHEKWSRLGWGHLRPAIRY